MSSWVRMSTLVWVHVKSNKCCLQLHHRTHNAANLRAQTHTSSGHVPRQPGCRVHRIKWLVSGSVGVSSVWKAAEWAPLSFEGNYHLISEFLHVVPVPQSRLVSARCCYGDANRRASRWQCSSRWRTEADRQRHLIPVKLWTVSTTSLGAPPAPSAVQMVPLAFCGAIPPRCSACMQLSALSSRHRF